ncbi:MAG: glycosyltransferase [Burkholderiaceae bacterium]|nr:MAG: glycosyltransferase [Burkholderiaceae bacterium]
MSSLDPQSPTEPVVAVLLCVHAGADAGQFDEALASMREQTHRRLSLYVYCDGPLKPDHEAIIAKRLRLADGVDHVVRAERAAGLPTGLNRLIELALSDPEVGFLARMDADDISMPQRIERQVVFLGAHPEVTIAGTWCIEFTEPNVPLFHKRLPERPSDVPRAMLLRSALAHPTVMFRRAVFERGHRYDPKFLVMQDYELWSRLIIAGEQIANVPEYLLWFRIGDGFFNRRHGMRRAWNEVMLRLDFARRSRQFGPKHLAGLVALFLVRVMPGPVKRLAYRHRR